MKNVNNIIRNFILLAICSNFPKNFTSLPRFADVPQTTKRILKRINSQSKIKLLYSDYRNGRCIIKVIGDRISYWEGYDIYIYTRTYILCIFCCYCCSRAMKIYVAAMYVYVCMDACASWLRDKNRFMQP